MAHDQEINELLDRLFGADLNIVEKQVLWAKLKNLDENTLDTLLERSWNKFEPKETFDAGKANILLKTILDKAGNKNRALRSSTRMFSLRWIRVAAAVFLIVSSGIFAFYIFNNKPARRQAGEQAIKSTVIDVRPPSVSTAVLMLGSGQRMYIDSLSNGTFASEGNVKLQKLADGRIAYNGSTSDTVYNTLINPKGSKVVNMKLADGSEVWLNAGSTITFPVVFRKNIRQVNLSGEAYFEVKHDATRPFIVQKGETSIEVLGTHFNVNAYDDETYLKVTLLEGAVRVKKEKSNALLKPGQQAVLSASDVNKNSTGLIQLINDIDTDEVMAWKNGEFQFEELDIHAIMRQISRWYNVEVEYRGNVTGQFWGSISRNVNVSQVLNLLEKTQAMKYTIEGNKVIISP